MILTTPRSMLAYSSKDPADCSREMFQYLCSYHQIPPSFLDNVFSFKDTLHDYDCSLASFVDENTLLDRPQHVLSLPELGRSGREIRHSFLLRSVEFSDSMEDRSFSIRQLAVYHCFDVVTGRTTWITLKQNELVEDRITEQINNLRASRPEALENVYEAFSATLDVHEIILDWCDENWRWFVNEIEVDSRDATKKARMVAVDGKSAGQDFIKLVNQRTSNLQQPSRRVTLAEAVKSWKPLSNWEKTKQSDVEEDQKATSWTPLRNWRRTRQPDVEEGQAETLEEERKARELMEKTEEFHLSGLQSLQCLMERIEEAILVLELNGKAVRKMREHYGDLAKGYRVKEMKGIRKHCGNDLLRFLNRVSAVENNMATRKAQLESRLSLVREGKNMVSSFHNNIPNQVPRYPGDSHADRIPSTVRRHHPTPQQRSRAIVRQRSPAVGLRHAPNRSQDEARNVVDARHHHCDAHLPPMGLYRGTYPPLLFLSLFFIIFPLPIRPLVVVESADEKGRWGGKQAFFQSGIMIIGDDGKTKPKVNTPALKLFAEVCAPTTFIIILIWSATFCRKPERKTTKTM